MPAPRPVSPPPRRRTAAVLAPACLGLLALGVVLGTTGCGPGERGIAAARARHLATVDGFVVRQEPVAGGGLKQDVELGLTVRWEDGEGSGGAPLPGITLDVDQVDAAGKGKRHWRVWVDMAGLRPGGEIRSIQVLKDIEYAPGDVFRAEVRREVPAAERAEYREFAGGAESAGGAPATGSGPTS